MKKTLLLLFLILSLNLSAKTLEKVSLQLIWLDQFQFAGYYMAKERGFYEGAGLDVEIKKYKYSMDTTLEVLSGRATFGVGRSSLIRQYSEGKNVVLLSAIFQSSPFILLALESSNIESVKDFKGKKLMLTKNAVETASIHAMILSNGAKESDMTFKTHNFNLEELINGKVDLYASYVSNEPYTLKQRDIAYKIFSPKNNGFDFYSDLLFTSQEEAIKNPKRVKRFREASLKGWEYAFAHIEETVTLIHKKYNSQNKTLEALTYEANELKKLAYSGNLQLGNISNKKILQIHDVYKIMGFTKNKLKIQDLIFDNISTLFNKEERDYLKNKQEIRICVLPDSLPYSAIENGKYIGIGSEMLAITSKEFGITYKLVKASTWMNSLKKGVNRECDLLPIASKTPSQEKFFNFTTPIHHEPIIIVTNKKKPYIVEIETVMDKSFSIVNGHPFIEQLKSRYPQIKLHRVKSTKEGFKAVKNGLYYGHIDVLMNAAYGLKHCSNNKLQISGQFEKKVAIGFAVKKNDKILFNIFEKISKNLKSSELQKLLNNWVSINYTNQIDYKYIKNIFIVIFVFMFIFLYRHYILDKKNRELQLLQNELVDLNKSLEGKVSNAVNEIVKKDAFLMHQSRLAQMGEMLSMIAHQWKQPLSSISTMNIAIKMALELEQYNLSDKKEREDFIKFLYIKLDKIAHNTQNLSKIIANFSDFYKPHKHSEVVTLDSVILKSKVLFEDIIKSAKIKVIFDLNANDEIYVHENEFMQVILNIVNNAKEQLIHNYIGDNAIINIKTYSLGNDVFMEISDNGGGISEDVIENLFDPYFSTKQDKNGTGLGLYMSKIIIKNYHNGNIYAKNIKNIRIC